MASISVRVEKELYDSAVKEAQAEYRSAPQQINFWAKIGRNIMGPLSRPRSKILRVAVSRIILSSEASKVKLVGNLVA